MPCLNDAIVIVQPVALKSCPKPLNFVGGWWIKIHTDSTQRCADEGQVPASLLEFLDQHRD